MRNSCCSDLPCGMGIYLPVSCLLSFPCTTSKPNTRKTRSNINLEQSFYSCFFTTFVFFFIIRVGHLNGFTIQHVAYITMPMRWDSCIRMRLEHFYGIWHIFHFKYYYRTCHLILRANHLWCRATSAAFSSTWKERKGWELVFCPLQWRCLSLTMWIKGKLPSLFPSFNLQSTWFARSCMQNHQ